MPHWICNTAEKVPNCWNVRLEIPPRSKRKSPNFRKRADAAGTVDHAVDYDFPWIDELGPTFGVGCADPTGDD